MRKKISAGWLAFLLVLPQTLSAESPSSKAALFGTASWYSESDPGINLHTANGEIFDDAQRTCASWDFPFGTLLRVTSLKNGRSVICRVNDRGPSKKLGRLIDLTKTAFHEVAPLRTGLIPVKVEEMGPAQSGLLNQHVNADPDEEHFDQNEESFARDSFQNLLSHVGTEAHYQSKAQAG